jgi:hypothetical protein
MAAINPLAAEKLWVWVIAGLSLWSVVLVFTVRERITRKLLGPGQDDLVPPARPSP